jgi:hypothetical protein
MSLVANAVVWELHKKQSEFIIASTDHATPLYPQKLALTSPTSGRYSSLAD